jgi:membrane associated rhomboid family serine protease
VSVHADRARLRHAFLGVALLTALLWWIKVLDRAFGWDLGMLGIEPRTAAGLVGVLTAPLLHGSFEHLFANTLPLLVLGTLLLYGYPRARLPALATIWLLSGLGVWAFGRDSTHIGMSGVTHGLMFFLFIAGLVRRERLAVALSMIAFFLYGGMVWGVFPTEPGVSWEYHLYGALSGVLAAIALRRADAPPPAKRYAWEDEPAEAEDPVIGDQWRWRRAPARPWKLESSDEFPVAGDDPLDDEPDERPREAPLGEDEDPTGGPVDRPPPNRTLH